MHWSRASDQQASGDPRHHPDQLLLIGDAYLSSVALPMVLVGAGQGLAVLSAVALRADAGLEGPAAAVERFGAALTGSSVLLAVALLVVLVLLVPRGRREVLPVPVSTGTATVARPSEA